MKKNLSYCSPVHVGISEELQRSSLGGFYASVYSHMQTKQVFTHVTYTSFALFSVCCVCWDTTHCDQIKTVSTMSRSLSFTRCSTKETRTHGQWEFSLLRWCVLALPQLLCQPRSNCYVQLRFIRRALQQRFDSTRSPFLSCVYRYFNSDSISVVMWIYFQIEIKLFSLYTHICV